MGLLQLSNHVVQNRHTGEQMTHWDMLKKENSNLVAFFNMSQCVICSPVWRFVPRDCSAAKGPLLPKAEFESVRAKASTPLGLHKPVRSRESDLIEK